MLIYNPKKRKFFSVHKLKYLDLSLYDQEELFEKTTKMLEKTFKLKNSDNYNRFIYVSIYQLLFYHYAYDYFLPTLIIKNNQNVFLNNIVILPSFVNKTIKNELKIFYILPSRISLLSYIYKTIYNMFSFVKLHNLIKCDLLYLKIPNRNISDEIIKSLSTKMQLYQWVSYTDTEQNISTKEGRIFFKHHIKKSLKTFYNDYSISSTALKGIINRRAIHYCSLLKATNPKIVISFNEYNHNGGIQTLVCYKAGAISVNIAHAVSIGLQRRHSPYNYHFVFGRSSTQHYKNVGAVVCGEIVESGSPHFDTISSMQKQDVIKTNKKNILIFSDSSDIGFLEYKHNYLSLLKEYFIDKTEEFSIIIKKHPRECLNIEESYFKRLDNTKIYSNGNNNYELINWSDYVIICQIVSTSGLEAILCNKILGIINIHNNRDLLKYQQYNCASILKSPKDIEKFLNRKYDDNTVNNYNKFIDFHFSNLRYSSQFITGKLAEIFAKA